MSNSTYCEDHYEQPDWMKEIQGLEKQNKELRELLKKKEKESIDKEKIRKEVERLRKIHQMKYQQLDADSSMSLVECGKRNLCNELLRFIDSMKEEPISEDERIRKQTLKVLNYYKDEEKSEGRMPTEIEECIAWIEKQGEQKPTDKVEPKFKIGDVIRLKGSAAEYTIKRVTDTTYYTDGWSCGIERCEEDYELVEQNLIVWSKEDKRILTTLINYLEEHGGGIDGYECIFLADWLKSLRPQSQWKPSEEQIGVIEAVINNRSFQRRHLDSLYEQLKKLREEL